MLIVVIIDILKDGTLKGMVMGTWYKSSECIV
jgi:hypothetical protein